MTPEAILEAIKKLEAIKRDVKSFDAFTKEIERRVETVPRADADKILSDHAVEITLMTIALMGVDNPAALSNAALRLLLYGVYIGRGSDIVNLSGGSGEDVPDAFKDLFK